MRDLTRARFPHFPPGVLRYLVLWQGVCSAFVNFAINFVLGVFTYQDQAAVATWVWTNGAFADSISTCFLLPLVTCFITTPIVRRQASRGVVNRIPTSNVPRLVRLMADPVSMRAGQFGILCTVLLVAPIYLAYTWLVGETMETIWFITSKATFAATLGLVVTPLIAYVTLCESVIDQSNEVTLKRSRALD